MGRYELSEVIGQGGMATVFRARDQKLRRDVAVKVLFPHLCQNRDIARRFQREARAAAALDDPRIVRVLDVGGEGAAEDGLLDPPYIVLELCRGGSVEARLEGLPPPPAEIAAALGARIAGALAVAHRAGIIHRDVKPGNVLVLEAGRVALADFGVARVIDEDSIVTRTGALVGTPSFMSPEQAMGDAATAASDLYSLGATLYRIATGALPFSGPTPRVVTAIAAGDFVPPLRRRRQMGPDLAAVIERLMALSPAARYADAEAAAAALVEVATAGGLDGLDEALAAYFEDPEAATARLVPVIVGATLDGAETASGAGNLPRALALADRALALDDGNARAMAVIRRAGSRRRARVLAAMVGAVAAVALVVAAGWWAWGARAPADGAAVSMVSANDAAAAMARAAADGPKNRAAGGPHPRVGAPVRPKIAAVKGGSPGPGQKNRAGGGPHPRAGPHVGPKTATVKGHARGSQKRHEAERGEGRLPTPDAGPPPAMGVDAATAKPSPATIHLQVNVWCNLTVDGRAAGQIVHEKSLTLAPGRHRLACSQGRGMPSWAQTLTVAAGETRTVAAAVLAEVPVKVTVTRGDAVEIRGHRHATGAIVALSPDRYRVTILDHGRAIAGGWVTVPRAAKACTLGNDLRLACE